MAKRNIGLSFSGGGVHSWAEAAVYEELVKQNIEIQAVTGTSMGSFLAAGVASGLTSDELYNVIRKTDSAITQSGVFGKKALLNLFSLRQPLGLVLMEKVFEIIKPVSKIYSEVMLSDVPKPLAIPAVDIIKNKLIIFSNQPDYFDGYFENTEFYKKDIPLIKACLASSAYPIILSPIKIDGYQLIDGGVKLNSPAALFSKEYIDYVLAIRVNTQKIIEPADKHIDVGLRSIEIMIEEQEELTKNRNGKEYLMELDLPGVFDFGGSEAIIQAGRNFVKNNPLSIYPLVNQKQIKEDETEKRIIIAEPLSKKQQILNQWKKWNKN